MSTASKRLRALGRSPGPYGSRDGTWHPRRRGARTGGRRHRQWTILALISTIETQKLMDPYTPRPSLLRQRDIESPCCSDRTCDGTGSRRVGSGRAISPMNACRKDTDHHEPRSTQQRDRPGQYSLLRKTVGRNEPERRGSRACGRRGQLRRRSHCEALR